jgi:hypothetical protein
MKRYAFTKQIFHAAVWNGEPHSALTPEADGRCSFVGCRKITVVVEPGMVILWTEGGLKPCSALSRETFEKHYEEVR